MFSYEELPSEVDFSTEFPTYIIAFCPDTDSWFVTNKRFFYYEYEKEFETEKAGIEYFKSHAKEFLDLEFQMEVYRPSFYNDGVYLDNLEKLIIV